jgi:hypothetical protein
MPRPSTGWIAVLSLTLCVALVALVAYRQDSHDVVLEGKVDAKAAKSNQEDDVLNVLEQEAAKASVAAHRAQLRASEAHNLVSKETKIKMKTAAEQRDALLRQDKDLHTSTDKAKEAIKNEKQAAARYNQCGKDVCIPCCDDPNCVCVCFRLEYRDPICVRANFPDAPVIRWLYRLVISRIDQGREKDVDIFF